MVLATIVQSSNFSVNNPWTQKWSLHLIHSFFYSFLGFSDHPYIRHALMWILCAGPCHEWTTLLLFLQNTSQIYVSANSGVLTPEAIAFLFSEVSCGFQLFTNPLLPKSACKQDGQDCHSLAGLRERVFLLLEHFNTWIVDFVFSQVMCFYFVFTVFSTVGFGDIFATNTSERVCLPLLMLHCSVTVSLSRSCNALKIDLCSVNIKISMPAFQVKNRYVNLARTELRMKIWMMMISTKIAIACIRFLVWFNVRLWFQIYCAQHLAHCSAQGTKKPWDWKSPKDVYCWESFMHICQWVTVQLCYRYSASFCFSPGPVSLEHFSHRSFDGSVKLLCLFMHC